MRETCESTLRITHYPKGSFTNRSFRKMVSAAEYSFCMHNANEFGVRAWAKLSEHEVCLRVSFPNAH